MTTKQSRNDGELIVAAPEDAVSASTTRVLQPSHNGKPQHPVLIQSNIPADLKIKEQWMVWRGELHGKRWTKPPYQPNGRHAKSNDPTTWTSYETALAALDRFDGIGIALADGLCGIDIDDCIDDAGVISEMAQSIIKRMNSYTEKSPSGHGIHILFYVKVAKAGINNRNLGVELYSRAHFLTVTGNHLEGAPTAVEERTAQAAEICSQIAVAKVSHVKASAQPVLPKNLDDQSLLQKAMTATNGPKFSRLWNGDWGEYSSQSEADLALCSHLAFWTGGDPSHMDRLFRSSRLMREKWDERHADSGATYGELTISKALSGTTQYYNPNAQGHNGEHRPVSPDDPLEAPTDKGPVGAPDPAADRYTVAAGCICSLEHPREGQIYTKPLCNFAAQITEDVIRDDGQDVNRRFTIAGRLATGQSLPNSAVDSTSFNSMNWVSAKWGVRAIVYAGQSTKDKLREAIQHLSTAAQTRQVFTHTGWREIGGKRAFLVNGGAIGAPDLDVQLEGALERYVLPVNITDASQIQQGLIASLRLLDLAPYVISFPVWAVMFMAVLTEMLAVDFVLWLLGATGRMKSSLVALALAHFGADFADRAKLPATWEATANALEKMLFLAKDVPLVVDDYAPQSTSRDADAMERSATRIIRSVGNRSGRERMRSDTSLREAYRPRGVLVSTGEQLPSGQSVLARLLTVEIGPGEIDLAKLSAAQAEAHLYSYAMAGFIGWVGVHWDELSATLPGKWRGLRDGWRRPDQHPRLPEMGASLFLAGDLVLTYAIEMGAITVTQADGIRAGGKEALTELLRQQSDRVGAEQPMERFLAVIKELIAQGKAKLLPYGSGGAPLGDGDLLGWYDDDHVYVLSDIAYHTVAKFFRDHGGHFPITSTALHKRLLEQGLLVPSKDGNLTVIKKAAQSHRVLKLIRETLVP